METYISTSPEQLRELADTLEANGQGGCVTLESDSGYVNLVWGML